MADTELKKEIRATVLKWKLGVKSRDKRQENIVNNVFNELEILSDVLFSKYSGSSYQNKFCHRIVDLWPMTKRILEKLHSGIAVRLRKTPTTASPYFCKVDREVPREVFDIIWKEIVEHNGFGHEANQTTATVTIRITDRRKAVYIFNKMNSDGCIVEKAKLLRKYFDDESKAEVIITKEQPLIIKYRKNSEVLTLTFHYGYWNSFGIPQH